MAKVVWDAEGTRFFETGVDRGVLFQLINGIYDKGVGWSGLTAVNETPSGAEPNPWYADNMKYLNILSIEEFSGSIEAMYYPDEFLQYDGGAVRGGGVLIGQQARPKFGFSYRTLIGNDTLENAYGYKIHLVYGAQASPSEKNRTTINESPENTPLSWDFSTTSVPVTGLKPTAHIVIDSTKVTAANLQAFETVLYGTDSVDGRMPFPDEVITFFAGSAVSVTPQTPSYNATTHVITIPTTANVRYMIDGKVVTGTVTLTTGQTKVVKAVPAPGYYFPAGVDDDNSYTY